MLNRDTRNLLLPVGCITSSALHSLASALNRLSAWHRSHGGPRDQEPCLRHIKWDEKAKHPVATVYSGLLYWDLVYRDGAWHFLSEALKG
jgi:hypothetical protein